MRSHCLLWRPHFVKTYRAAAWDENTNSWRHYHSDVAFAAMWRSQHHIRPPERSFWPRSGHRKPCDAHSIQLISLPLHLSTTDEKLWFDQTVQRECIDRLIDRYQFKWGWVSPWLPSLPAQGITCTYHQAPSTQSRFIQSERYSTIERPTASSYLSKSAWAGPPFSTG